MDRLFRSRSRPRNQRIGKRQTVMMAGRRYNVIIAKGFHSVADSVFAVLRKVRRLIAKVVNFVADMGFAILDFLLMIVVTVVAFIVSMIVYTVKQILKLPRLGEEEALTARETTSESEDKPRSARRQRKPRGRTRSSKGRSRKARGTDTSPVKTSSSDSGKQMKVQSGQITTSDTGSQTSSECSNIDEREPLLGSLRNASEAIAQYFKNVEHVGGDISKQGAAVQEGPTTSSAAGPVSNITIEIQDTGSMVEIAKSTPDRATPFSSESSVTTGTDDTGQRTGDERPESDDSTWDQVATDSVSRHTDTDVDKTSTHSERSISKLKQISELECETSQQKSVTAAQQSSELECEATQQKPVTAAQQSSELECEASQQKSITGAPSFNLQQVISKQSGSSSTSHKTHTEADISRDTLVTLVSSHHDQRQDPSHQAPVASEVARIASQEKSEELRATPNAQSGMSPSVSNHIISVSQEKVRLDGHSSEDEKIEMTNLNEESKSQSSSQIAQSVVSDGENTSSVTETKQTPSSDKVAGSASGEHETAGSGVKISSSSENKASEHYELKASDSQEAKMSSGSVKKSPSSSLENKASKHDELEMSDTSVKKSPSSLETKASKHDELKASDTSVKKSASTESKDGIRPASGDSSKSNTNNSQPSDRKQAGRAGTTRSLFHESELAEALDTVEKLVDTFSKLAESSDKGKTAD